MKKIVKLTANTPGSSVDITVSIELINGNYSNDFIVKVSSETLMDDVQEEYNRCRKDVTELYGFLSHDYFNVWSTGLDPDEWDETFTHLYLHFNTFEKAEDCFKDVIRKFKSFYKSLRADYSAKAEILDRFDPISFAKEEEFTIVIGGRWRREESIAGGGIDGYVWEEEDGTWRYYFKDGDDTSWGDYDTATVWNDSHQKDQFINDPVSFMKPYID